MFILFCMCILGVCCLDDGVQPECPNHDNRTCCDPELVVSSPLMSNTALTSREVIGELGTTTK